MTAELTFVDTNVLLYAHDRTAGGKRDRARSLLAGLWNTRTGLLSTQILQEFYVNATRKLERPISAPQARRVIARYATWPVWRIEPGDIVAASELERRHRLSFWDALVVVTAQRSSATVLVTEDLQAGRKYGPLRVVDPFVG